MALTPPTRDRTRCCSRCTRRPALDGCHNITCACHDGAPRPRPEPVPERHVCERENCPVCLP